MQTTMTPVRMRMRGIRGTMTSSGWGGRQGVGTLYIGREGIAFLTSEDGSPEELCWPEVVGRLDLSAGDWHCPRFAVKAVRQGGWATGLSRLGLGRQAGRYRGFVLQGDCSRYLLIPAEAGELFETWLGALSRSA